MFCSLSQKVFPFFDDHLDPRRPLLLGLSGGSDSTCLLHLLLEYRKIKPLNLHLAHVDHGWRKESTKEREELCKMAKELQLSIHTHVLSFRDCTENLENQCRIARLDFFTKTAVEIDAQGILLAHQQEDQLETVFKRFLEGVNLLRLRGMQPVTQMGSLTLFRPLLDVSKEEIMQFLRSRKLAFFDDPTNRDTKFLRAKMREEIFPYLKGAFGKDFQTAILHISKQALELESYVVDKINPYLENSITSCLGTFFDFSTHFPETPFERRALFLALGERLSLCFNRVSIEQASELIITNAANKTLQVDGKTLFFDRGRLFFLEEEDECPNEQVPLHIVPLHIGTSTFGSWQVEVVEGKAGHLPLKNGWLDVWKGEVATCLPKGDYVLGQAVTKARSAFSKKVLARALNEKKVPHFLWKSCPYIFSGQEVMEDFLLCYNKNLTTGPLLYITLKKVAF